MRLCGFALALGCCGPSMHAVGPDVRRDEPGCRREHNSVDVGAVADAPLAVVYEHMMFYSSDVPAIALWADGTLAFSAKREWFAAQLGADVASQISAAALAALRAAPRHAETSRDETDLPVVEVIVRDGTAWRVSDVRGLLRGDRGDGVAAAYRRLLAPAHGTAHYTPDAIAVDYEPVADYTGELAWPAEVPTPADLEMAGEIVVPAADEPALRALALEVERSGRAVVVAGHHFRFHLRRRFRGQDAIDRVIDCARDR